MSKANHTLLFPGDKSLSHRAAIFSAIAKGESHIENYLPAEDTMNTLSAFTFLGTEFKERGDKIIVRSPGIENWHSDAVRIDLGNSGTAARLLLGLFAGKPGSSVEITGDASLRKRPMARVTKVLEQYGAKYSTLEKLPIKVDGVQLAALEHEEVKGSAQIKSALMLAAIASQTKLLLHELKPSRDHTEKVLRFLGCEILKEKVDSGFKIQLNPPYSINANQFQIWGDVSSAAFFVVLASLLNIESLTIENVLLNRYRSEYLEVLKSMGANIEIQELEPKTGELGANLIIKPAQLRAIQVKPEQVPSIIDEIPILTVAAVFSEGEFIIKGAEELRVKESDRIHAMVVNLRNLGITVEEFDDGFSLKGNPNAVLNGEVESFLDHRVVMSFEIAKLRSIQNAEKAKSNSKVVIQGQEWVNTSFPSFYNLIRQVMK